jgi:hypothetical protein
MKCEKHLFLHVDFPICALFCELRLKMSGKTLVGWKKLVPLHRFWESGHATAGF